jgi:hypothetical protein
MGTQVLQLNVMGLSTMRKQRHSCQLSRDHLTCISEDKMLQEAESICREGGVVRAGHNKVVMVVEAKHHIIHVGEW